MCYGIDGSTTHKRALNTIPHVLHRLLHALILRKKTGHACKQQSPLALFAALASSKPPAISRGPTAPRLPAGDQTKAWPFPTHRLVPADCLLLLVSQEIICACKGRALTAHAHEGHTTSASTTINQGRLRGTRTSSSLVLSIMPCRYHFIRSSHSGTYYCSCSY